jgi:hypothetical protein
MGEKGNNRGSERTDDARGERGRETRTVETITTMPAAPARARRPTTGRRSGAKKARRGR